MPGSSMSKVELFAAIRRDLRAGMSKRAVQGKYRISWHTVDEAAFTHRVHVTRCQAMSYRRIATGCLS